MSQEERAELFQLYYRTDEARRSSVRGAGVGLFIVKSLVDAHGGQISVETEQGQGTSFTVRLPANGLMISETGE